MNSISEKLLNELKSRIGSRKIALNGLPGKYCNAEKFINNLKIGG